VVMASVCVAEAHARFNVIHLKTVTVVRRAGLNCSAILAGKLIAFERGMARCLPSVIIPEEIRALG